MDTVLETDDIRISFIKNESRTLTVCFTGVGHQLGGIDVQSEEFMKSSQNAASLFVIDKNRTWGNSLDFDLLLSTIRSLGDWETINTLGNSMGGFLAILATKFLPVSSCVAFVPQYSVHKSIVPNEHRWDKYINNIKDWKHIDLRDAFLNGTQYYILAAVGGLDDRHLVHFPTRDNIHKIYFKAPDNMHGIAQLLKSDRNLYDVISDCFAKHSASQIIDKRLQSQHYSAYSPES